MERLHAEQLKQARREEGGTGPHLRRLAEQSLTSSRRFHHKHALRDASAEVTNFSVYLRNSTTSVSSYFASSTLATSTKLTYGLSPDISWV
jgi:hypothetical protein